ncbi:MAG: diguanylate cyclase, partial [Chloroflexota bacterium]|nr:diguanylate cyclase [Chloroflexota bacterium]
KQEPMALPREGGLTYTIAKSGNRFLVPNMETHELFANTPNHWKGAIIGLPLKFMGKVIGVMNIAFSEPRSFTKKDLRILDLLSDQASLAINNARIFETEKKQRQMAEVLQTTGQIVKSSLDLDTVLDRILTQLENVVPYDTANLALIEQEKVRVVRNLGYEEFNGQGIPVPTDLSQEMASFPMLHHVFKTQQSATVSDTASDPRWVTTNATSYIRSWVGAPILGREGVIGFLFLNKTEKGFYKPKHAEWIAVLADQAAIAIDNARLYKNSQQYARELKSLHQATSTLVTTLDFDELLENILTAAIESLPAAEKGSLMINNPETQRLEIRAAKGYPDERIKDFALSLSNGYAAQAFKEKKAKIFTNIQKNSPIYYKSDIAGISSVQSAISVPLLSREKQSLGVLSLDSTKTNAFTAADLEMLSSFAATATSAILNAQLHAKVQKLAITDSLTHALNRRGLFQWGEREFVRAQRFKRPLSAIFFDLDHFKEVNDTYGHDVGDLILAKIAARCQDTIRQIDILGRYGGEEFVVVLPETDIQEAFTTAERIRKVVSASPFIINSIEIEVSISLGVAESSHETKNLTDLIKMADQSMYHSKQNGRNRTTQYN